MVGVTARRFSAWLGRVLASAVCAGWLAVPAAAAAETRGLPASLAGLWAELAASCARPDADDRVEIQAGEIVFFASACRITWLGETKPGDYRMVTRCEAEGEAETRSGRVTATGRDRLDIQLGGVRHRLMRCPAASR